ncbi:unnamed protein product [Pedinophyceae sp. YPF-701]|nr:unnamed protein product [Pedinophyceae sp. YPF-701]
MEDRPIDGELTFSCNNLVFLGTMNRDTGRPEKGTLTNKREEWEYSGTLNGSMEFDGAGRMRHPDYVYEGGWRAGLQDGEGKMTRRDGGEYQGEWRRGVFHGQGTLTALTCPAWGGIDFEGPFEEGVPNGVGQLRLGDGTSGTWLEGKWVQSSADGWKSGIEGLPDAVDAGERVHFSIVARDDQGNQRLSGGDKYRVVVQLGEGEDVDSAQSFDAEDDANGRYSLDFVCQKAGRHDVHVFLVANDAEDGAEVHEALAGSPFMLSVQPSAPDPSSCRVSLRGDGSPIATGDCVQVDVLVRDRFGNDCAAVDALHFARKLTWRLLDSSGKDVMPQIDFDGTAAPTNALQNAEGDIRVVKSCRPPGPGMYRMHVAVEGGGELRGSPLSVQVHGDNLADAAGASSQPPPVDVAALWARIAAVELAGETESRDSSDERETAEEAYIRQHPDVPVVADLQDMWLVSRYQAERKRAERLASDRGGQGL